MGNPFELNVYPLWDNGFGDMYADKNDPTRPARVDFEVYRKRLTDTELAAEYHAQHMEAVKAHDRAYPYGESEELDVENARIDTVLRFATLPHHDEPAHAD